MLFSSWLRSLKSPARLTRTARRRKRRLFSAVGIECLEDRTMLSAVTIEPGAFEGLYRVSGITSDASGPLDVDLDQGSYRVIIASSGNFIFNVDASGQVTSTNTDAAVRDATDGSNSTLIFKTSTITIDPGAYTGLYQFGGNGITGFVSGIQSDIVVVSALRYGLNVENDKIVIDVDANGHVTSNNTGAAVVDADDPSKLNFKTSAITIDPQGYEGVFRVGNVTGGFVSGTQNLTVVSNIRNYGIQVASASFTFDVDAAGNVTSNRPTSVQGSGDTLTLLNTTIIVDPGSFEGIYRVSVESRAAAGLRSITMIPDIATNSILIGSEFITFGVDASGNVTSNRPTAFQGSGNTLTFNNTTMNVDPGAFEGRFHLGFGGFLAGARSFIMVPDVSGYPVHIGGGRFKFNIDAGGNVTSNSVAAAQGSGNTLTFNTTTINIDPGEFEGIYWVPWVDGFGRGPRSVVVVPDVNSYGLASGGTVFSFKVDADGNVISNRPTSAEGSGNTLTLKNTTIHVDPGTFEGTHGVVFVAANATGQRNITLIPDTNRYVLRLREAGQLRDIRFSVNVNGEPDPSTVSVTFASGTHTILLSKVTNQPPALGTITDKSVNEASTLSVTAAATDPDAGDTLTFSLDSAPTGAVIDPITGIFTWTPTDGAATESITVRVTDAAGEFDTETFEVEVINLAPTVTITGPEEDFKGNSVSFTLGANDPSSVDQAAGFTYNIDWDGDGTVDQTVNGADGLGVTHAFTEAGETTVIVTATDKDGGVSAAVTHTIDVIQPVDIDVKPDSDTNTANLAANGVLAVVIYTTADFDASTVIVGSVTFAGAYVVQSSLVDIDGDGDLDLVLHFRLQEMVVLTADYRDALAADLADNGVIDDNHQNVEVTLRGETTDGIRFEGTDTLDAFFAGKQFRALLDEL